MLKRIKIFTHEVIIHSQLTAIERTLNRPIEYQITLNTKASRSSIEFDANDNEIDLLKDNLGYAVMVKHTHGWMPVI